MTPASVQVRAAEARDWPRLEALARAWPAHFVSAGIEAMHEDLGRWPALVAVAEGEIRGFVIWSDTPPDPEMLWLVVDPAHVRQGVGSALVQAVADRVGPARRLTLKTATTDSAIAGTAFRGSAYKDTHRFFQRLGFRDARVLRGAWGPTNHALEMARDPGGGMPSPR